MSIQVTEYIGKKPKNNGSKFSYVYDMTSKEAHIKYKKYRKYPKKISYLKNTKYKSSVNHFMSYLTSLKIRAKLRDR
jgi:hypothetical protein